MPHPYMYIYIHIYIYIYIYIYIFLYLYFYIYIYIYKEGERASEREKRDRKGGGESEVSGHDTHARAVLPNLSDGCLPDLACVRAQLDTSSALLAIHAQLTELVSRVI